MCPSVTEALFCVSLSDGGRIRSRHRDGEVLQHQVPRLGAAAQRGGPGRHRPGPQDARRGSQRESWGVPGQAGVLEATCSSTVLEQEVED